MPHLISVDELDTLLDSGRPVRLIDVRWRPDRPEGRPPYVAGHLPNAVYVDLETELSWRGHPELGRHPLPPLDQLEATVRQWGVNAGDVVIAYDDNNGYPAARAWWLLRTRGVDIRVLDGGLRAWMKSGRPLQSGDVIAESGDIELSAEDPGTRDIDDAASVPQFGILVDVRTADHYAGWVPGPDPAAGHIPGAINVPALSHLDEEGKLKAPETIRAALLRHGIAPGVDVTIYCASGIGAAHSVLAYSLAGVEATLYAGSWSQWSGTRGRPVAIGVSPSDHISGW